MNKQKEDRSVKRTKITNSIKLNSENIKFSDH